MSGAVADVFQFVSSGVATLREVVGLLSVPVPEFGELALRAKNGDVRKIVIVPGDEARSFGRLGPARGPGGPIKRRIATGPEYFRVYLAGYEASEPSNALVQYTEANRLLDVVFPMLRNSRRDFQPISQKWVVNSLIAPFGASLMLVCSVQRSIEDWSEGEAVEVAPVEMDMTSRWTAPEE